MFPQLPVALGQEEVKRERKQGGGKEAQKDAEQRPNGAQ